MFSYHGAEHKTIFCYEAGLPLTVENVPQNAAAPSPLRHQLPVRGGRGVHPGFPSRRVSFSTGAIRGRYRMLILLLLLPVVVGITYEINRYVRRTRQPRDERAVSPGLWLQNFTTNEPDDSMIEVGIAAVQAVLPEKEGTDRW